MVSTRAPRPPRRAPAAPRDEEMPRAVLVLRSVGFLCMRTVYSYLVCIVTYLFKGI